MTGFISPIINSAPIGREYDSNPSQNRVNADSVGEITSTQPSGGTQEELEKLGYLLSKLQLLIAQFKEQTESGRSRIDTELVRAASALTHQVVNAVNTYHQLEAQEKSESFWSRLAGDLLTAITLVVSAATGQWGLVAITIAIVIMTQTGSMQRIEQGIADLLEKAGCSPLVANLLSDIIIIATTILITHAGEGAAARLGSTAAKAGESLEEAATNSVDESASEGSDNAAAGNTHESRLNGVSRLLERIRPSNIKILSGMQVMMATSFTSNLADLMASNISNPKTKAIMEGIFEALILIAASIAMVKGISNLGSGTAGEGDQAGKGAAGAAQMAAREDNLISQIKQQLQKLESLVQEIQWIKAPAVLFKATNGLADLSAAVEGGASLSLGITNVRLAAVTKQWGTLQSSMFMIQSILNQMNAQSSTNQESTTATELGQFNQMIGELGNAFASPHLAMAQEFAG